MTLSSSIAVRDFSKSTIKSLFKKGISIISCQAAPAYEGDKYFTGTSYQLVTSDGYGMIRSHSQVLAMAEKSWQPPQE